MDTVCHHISAPAGLDNAVLLFNLSEVYCKHLITNSVGALHGAPGGGWCTMMVR